jgi:thiol-disulfide isomerase/thioredoxin
MQRPLVHAPDFGRHGLPWLNVGKPLSLADVAGRLVILDFWTFCCINCMQVLPTLKRIEQAFPEEVLVIGVHSPKFRAERDLDNLKAAIARYDIRHPVVQDTDMLIWREYGVRAWPTLVFISPDGYVLGHAAGEPDPDRLFEVVSRVIEEGKEEGSIRARPLDLDVPERPRGPLLYPGKVKRLPMADGTSRWVVADSGHHQVVVLDELGKELIRYGSGQAGFEDGPLKRANFNGPQGLIADDGSIYVADTGNHAIRRIDRSSGEVTTLAGTGRRGPRLNSPLPGRDAALASVWDLELQGGRLYFANAGTHQIGVLDLGDGTVRAFAGNGGEDIADGPALEALLAQPSGLALDPAGRRLAFADSETSSVRLVELADGPPRVRTLIGTGLFDFGHANGGLTEARLQHPLGVAWVDDGRLAVADSYNGAVRIIDIVAGEIADLDEGNYVCRDELCVPLAEPAGVAVDGHGRILVSDTNNHRIVAYEPAAHSYRTLAG